MTDLQLWLSIGIPSLLIVLAWLQANSRLADLKESLSQRIGRFETQVEIRFNQMEARFSKWKRA